MDQRLLQTLGGNTDKYPRNLEDKYPRVFSKILELWGTPELDAYFMELTVSERTNRAGFPPDVVSEILYLSFVHAALHAKNTTKKDAWDVSVDALACYVPQTLHEAARPPVDPPAPVKLAIEGYGLTCSTDGFLRAAETGNDSAVALFLEAQFNTEIRDERGWTPLMLASFNGHDTVSYLLLKHGASVNAVDFCGNTALHWAAFAGHVANAKLLIDHHADVNLLSCSGWTPLFQATTRHNLEVVQLLIDRGANYNATSRDGWTALHKAAAKGYHDVAGLLLRKGANRYLKNSDGDTPLMLASKNKHDTVKELLMSAPSGTSAHA